MSRSIRSVFSSSASQQHEKADKRGSQITRQPLSPRSGFGVTLPSTCIHKSERAFRTTQTRIAFFIRRIRYRFRGQCDPCILSETLLQIPETVFSFGSQQRVVDSTLNPFQKIRFAIANLCTFLLTRVSRCRIVKESINLDDEKKSLGPCFHPGLVSYSIRRRIVSST